MFVCILKVLEVIGNEVMWREITGRPGKHGACLSIPCCVVVTVNRVQSTFNVPIYDTAGGDLDTLNSYVLSRAKQLHPVLYSMQQYNTVHVADLFLTEGSGCGGGVTDILDKGTSVDVSVLLPVYNEELLLPRLLDSLLLQQTYCSFEIVAVLNGCTDSSEDILRSYNGLFQTRGVCLTVLVLPARSLVNALDAGLARCRGNFVARVDADDIALGPSRLDTQLQFLSRHFPDVRVVGSQAVVIPEGSAESSALTVAGNIPCDRVVLEWMMLFRCVLLHPTGMFHRDSVLAVGGYGGAGAPMGGGGAGSFGGEGAQHRVEDYSLWARVLMRWVNVTCRLVQLRFTYLCVCVHMIRYPFSICNIPHVTTALQLRSGSKSEAQRDTAVVDAFAVRCSLANHLLEREMWPLGLDKQGSAEGGRWAEAKPLSPEEERSLMLVSYPHLVSSSAELQEACRVLQALTEEVFIPLVPTSRRSAESLQILRNQKEIMALKLIAAGCATLNCGDAYFKKQCCDVLHIEYSALFKYELMFSLGV